MSNKSKHYEVPVELSAEAGFTYSLDTQAAYALNDSIGMNMQSAVVPAPDMVLDATIGYMQAARASHNQTSFKSVLSTKLANIIKSMDKRVDISAFYGQSGIGDIAIDGFTETSGGATTASFVVTEASWATGIWAGCENAALAFYSDSSVVIDAATNLNANATSDLVTITGIDSDTRTVSVSSTADAIEDINDVSATKALRVYWYGAVSGTGLSFILSEQVGLQKILTSSGSVFGISTSYDLWKGNSKATTGALTMAKVLSYGAKPVQKGLEGIADLWVNPFTWADMASNLAALRRFDGSYSRKKAENGSEVLEYVSQNGTILIHSYNIVKQGDSFLLPRDKVMRVGAREVGLNDPVKPQDEIFFTIPNRAGVGVRGYTNQQVFCEAPAQALYISGIQNSSN